jgi:cytochrome b561
MAEPRNRYGAVSLTLHWVTALAVLTQVLLIAAGDAAADEGARVFRDAHKSVGLTILVLTLVRIAWRVRHPALPLPADSPTWQNILARATHVGFYLALLALPLTGWLASSAAGREIPWFGLFNWPLLPIGGGRETAGGLMDIHRAVVKGMYVLIALHVVGALKHHLVDRDNVLHRMIPLIPRRP